MNLVTAFLPFIVGQLYTPPLLVNASSLRKLTTDRHECTLVKEEPLMLPGVNEKDFEQQNPEDQAWRCLLEKENDSHDYNLDGLPANYIHNHAAGWVSGATVLHLSKAEVVPVAANGTTSKIKVSQESEISYETSEAMLQRRRRRLAPSTGTGTVLVIRVIDSFGLQPTKTAEELSSDIFSDPLNLNSAYMACSGGKLGYEPATGDNIVNGVMEITLDKPVNGVDRFTVEDYVDDAVSGLPGSNDLVMYVVPSEVDFGTAAAYAYLGSWKSVYRDTYASYPVVLIHEVGHNLGLHHSGKGAQSYGDKTCWMGNGVSAFWANDDIPNMCFNAAKSWDLGWYADRHHEIDVTQTGYWEGSVVGVDDYLNDQIPGEDTTSKVVVKVNKPNSNENLFFMYNRKEGVNADVPYDFNKIVIVKKVAQEQSLNIAQLAQDEEYIGANFDGAGNDLVIKNCLTVMGTPDYANVLVCSRNGVNNCACDGTMSPTAAPTPCAGHAFKLTLLTDNYGGETTWTLTKGESSVAQGSGYSSNTEYVYEHCLAEGTYNFIINDTYGDGICCGYGNGSYTLSVGGSVIKSGGNFNAYESFQFTLGAPPNPPPPTAITSIPTKSPTVSPNPPPPTANTSLPTKSPTVSPTASPTKSPTESPTASPTKSPTETPTITPTEITAAPSTSACSEFELELSTDRWGEETSWSVTNTVGDVVLSSNGKKYNPFTVYYSTKCLQYGNYKFVIEDKYGDGICCEYGSGKYMLKVDNQTVAIGSQFGASEETSFQTPAPPKTCVDFEVGVFTDRYPDETSWELKDSNESVVLSAKRYNKSKTLYLDHDCLPYGNYTFHMFDSHNDGICCKWGSGYYTLSVNGVDIHQGGEFTGQETFSFQTSASGGVPTGEAVQTEIVGAILDEEKKN